MRCFDYPWNWCGQAGQALRINEKACLLSCAAASHAAPSWRARPTPPCTCAPAPRPAPQERLPLPAVGAGRAGPQLHPLPPQVAFGHLTAACGCAPGWLALPRACTPRARPTLPLCLLASTPRLAITQRPSAAPRRPAQAAGAAAGRAVLRDWLRGGGAGAQGGRELRALRSSPCLLLSSALRRRWERLPARRCALHARHMAPALRPLLLPPSAAARRASARRRPSAG